METWKASAISKDAAVIHTPGISKLYHEICFTPEHLTKYMTEIV